MSFSPFEEDFNGPVSSENIASSIRGDFTSPAPKSKHIAVMRKEYLNNWKVC